MSQSETEPSSHPAAMSPPSGAIASPAEGVAGSVIDPGMGRASAAAQNLTSLRSGTP